MNDIPSKKNYLKDIGVNLIVVPIVALLCAAWNAVSASSLFFVGVWVVLAACSSLIPSKLIPLLEKSSCESESLKDIRNLLSAFYRKTPKVLYGSIIVLFVALLACTHLIPISINVLDETIQRGKIQSSVHSVMPPLKSKRIQYYVFPQNHNNPAQADVCMFEVEDVNKVFSENVLAAFNSFITTALVFLVLVIVLFAFLGMVLAVANPEKINPVEK